MKKLSIFLCSIFLTTFIIGQNQQKNASYFEEEPGFFHKTMLPALQEKSQAEARKSYRIDWDDQTYPTDISLYEAVWHNDPLSQGMTGTCWCFATTSFLESEVYRLTGKKVKLSEMHTVYWEYIERARAFVENRGDIYFAQGSEATGVLRMMKKYGVVPLELYEGRPAQQSFHNHKALFNEMNSYLRSVVETNSWNEEFVVNTIRGILDHHLGEPPVNFEYDGMNFSPSSFLSDYLQLNLNDYYSFMSTLMTRYGEKGELVEPDNWWHEDSYYNIEVEDFLETCIKAIKKGYSLSICGDISEPGFDRWQEVAIIPSFDIPTEYIDKYSREYRLNNGTTTDDHCIHIIGYHQEDDISWFLIKDSGAGGFDGDNPGYRFLHEDYIRLKMMNIMIHKDGAPILDKLIK